jgi:hypothetical protein
MSAKIRLKTVKRRIAMKRQKTDNKSNNATFVIMVSSYLPDLPYLFLVHF